TRQGGLYRTDTALTVQRSVLEYPFRIRANLLRSHVGVTIRHISGARYRTLALRKLNRKPKKSSNLANIQSPATRTCSLRHAMANTPRRTVHLTPSKVRQHLHCASS